MSFPYEYIFIQEMSELNEKIELMWFRVVDVVKSTLTIPNRMVLYCIKLSIFFCDIHNLHMLNCRTFCIVVIDWLLPSILKYCVCAMEHNVPNNKIGSSILYETIQFVMVYVDFKNRMKKKPIQFFFSFNIGFSWRVLITVNQGCVHIP